MHESGKRNPVVVLTRLPEDNLALKNMLENEGIGVLEVPCFDIAYVEPQTEEIEQLLDFQNYDAVTFSSKNGVAGFFLWLESQAERRNQERPRIIAAVGPKTAEKLVDCKWQVDLVALPATGEQLAGQLLEKIAPAARVLSVRGDTSRDRSAKILREKGCTVHPLTVYRNLEPEIAKVNEEYDLVVYTSPLGAKRFLSANKNASAKMAVAIGTTTAEYLQSIPLENVIAESTDENALLDSILKALK